MEVSLGREGRQMAGQDYVVTLVQAKEVCDNIISETKRRFLFTSHLKMANLFLVELFAFYLSNFPVLHLH